jgi:hypothetical protein
VFVTKNPGKPYFEYRGKSVENTELDRKEIGCEKGKCMKWPRFESYGELSFSWQAPGSYLGN